jgi:hypothetical protein
MTQSLMPADRFTGARDAGHIADANGNARRLVSTNDKARTEAGFVVIM